MHDVIVIGAGHNGLTCGAYLARAGQRVVVLERREIVGGMCTTEETVAAAPGFKMNPCAVDTALTNIPVSVVDELNLAKYGLRFVSPDPWAAYINHDGASIGMWADRSRTQAEIAHLSRRDAEAFGKFCDMMTEAWWALMPYFQDHPTRPSFRTIGQVLWRAAKGRRSLRGAARVFMSSPEQVIEEHFQREEVKAVLANLAAWSMLPLQEDGSGGVLAMMCSYFQWAVKRPVGGNVYHVDVALTRLGPLRPALGFGGYRTPVPDLFITGAGTHPGPSVSGIPGQQAARTILREARRDGLTPGRAAQLREAVTRRAASARPPAPAEPAPAPRPEALV